MSSNFFHKRTDAISVHGINEAIRRGHSYAETGVAAVYVVAPTSLNEIEIIAKELSGETLLVMNMTEAGKTPIIPADELADMGYSIIAYPSTLLLRVITAIREGLQVIKDQSFNQGVQLTFSELTQLFGSDKWNQLENNQRDKGHLNN